MKQTSFFSLIFIFYLSVLSPLCPSSPIHIWEVQGLWRQPQSSSHDSSGLLGSREGQGWTAGMPKKNKKISPTLFFHLKASLLPSLTELCQSFSLSFITHSDDKPQDCPWHPHLKISESKDQKRKVSQRVCVCVHINQERKVE